MSTTDVHTETTAPELIWVGDGGWVACDPFVAENDARRVIAYVEHKDHLVYVLWVRAQREVCCYETLREAMAALSAVCSTPPSGGPRG